MAHEEELAEEVVVEDPIDQDAAVHVPLARGEGQSPPRAAFPAHLVVQHFGRQKRLLERESAAHAKARGRGGWGKAWSCPTCSGGWIRHFGKGISPENTREGGFDEGTSSTNSTMRSSNFRLKTWQRTPQTRLRSQRKSWGALPRARWLMQGMGYQNWISLLGGRHASIRPY